MPDYQNIKLNTLSFKSTKEGCRSDSLPLLMNYTQPLIIIGFQFVVRIGKQLPRADPAQM